MEWGISISILVPMMAFFGFLYKELKDWRKETKEETQETRREFQEQIQETRREFQEQIQETRREFQEQNQLIRKEFQEERKAIQEEIRLQSQRSDTLYQMFIDLLERQSPKTH